MSPRTRSLSLRVLKAFFSLFVGGAVIGVLHQYDSVVAGLLIILATLIYWLTYRSNPSPHRAGVLLVGGLITGLLGVVAEHWGISNGHWAYHDLSDGRSFARWLPFAWMIAFVFLYRVEEFFIAHLELIALKEKLLLALLCSAILPTWGEIVAINFGVWTYAWGYQLFGVPILAVVLLMLFHSAIFAAMTAICRRYAIEDRVFGSGENR